MSDYSDAVAGDVLVREGAGEGDSRVLRFRSRTRFVPVLMFGSWGLVVVLPMMLFLIQGELPGDALGALPVLVVGLALVYAAVRALVNRSALRVDGGELRFAFGPLWPFRERRVALGQLGGARMALRSASFWNPAKYRGYPMPQPYLIQLQLRDQRTLTLPLTLGLRDAESVSRWIEERL